MPAPSAALPPAAAVAIGLGANLGDAEATLRAAAAALAQLPGCTWGAGSSLYRSAPVDAQGPDFFNAVLLLHSHRSPLDLLDAMQAIEHHFGRQRPYRNAPRTLDLDLLLYGSHRLNHPRLSLPHPRLDQRAFVLHPLREVWPEPTLPGLPDWPTLLAGVADHTLERLTQRPRLAASVTAPQTKTPPPP